MTVMDPWGPVLDMCPWSHPEHSFSRNHSLDFKGMAMQAGRRDRQSSG